MSGAGRSCWPTRWCPGRRGGSRPLRSATSASSRTASGTTWWLRFTTRCLCSSAARCERSRCTRSTTSSRWRSTACTGTFSSPSRRCAPPVSSSRSRPSFPPSRACSSSRRTNTSSRTGGSGSSFAATRGATTGICSTRRACSRSRATTPSTSWGWAWVTSWSGPSWRYTTSERPNNRQTKR